MGHHFQDLGWIGNFMEGSIVAVGARDMDHSFRQASSRRLAEGITLLGLDRPLRQGFASSKHRYKTYTHSPSFDSRICLKQPPYFSMALGRSLAVQIRLK